MKKSFTILLAAIFLVACQSETKLETEQYSAEKTVYLTEQQTDSLHMSFEIEMPTMLEVDSVLPLIQHNLLRNLLGENYADMETPEAMANYMSVYETEYLSNNTQMRQEMIDNGDEDILPAFCEEQILSGRVLSVVSGIMSYSMEQYVYTGGAHGISNRFYFNYCLKTGKLLHDSDLFVDDATEILMQLLREQLVAQTDELQQVDELYTSYYYVDRIVPNNNFYLSEEGITYVFNPYEIAPYAYGATEIFIPKEQLLPILAAGCPLWK